MGDCRKMVLLPTDVSGLSITDLQRMFDLVPKYILSDAMIDHHLVPKAKKEYAPKGSNWDSGMRVGDHGDYIDIVNTPGANAIRCTVIDLVRVMICHLPETVTGNIYEVTAPGHGVKFECVISSGTVPDKFLFVLHSHHVHELLTSGSGDYRNQKIDGIAVSIAGFVRKYITGYKIALSTMRPKKAGGIMAVSDSGDDDITYEEFVKMMRARAAVTRGADIVVKSDGYLPLPGDKKGD